VKITLEVIPHSEQRLPDSLGGDWVWEGDNLTIRVSDLGDWRMNFLFARHEMDEAILCRHANITTEMVDADELKSSDDDDPDSFSGYPGSCYQQQHNDALAIEWLMSRLLDVDWVEYGKKVEALQNVPMQQQTV
jgi:hypothetical protein